MPTSNRVAALHDIVGIGRCSLTMVIPVLSAMGILPCPVPTAVFSAHTQYPNFIKQSLDGFVQDTLESYVREGVHFDAAYSGYLGDAGQIGVVKSFMQAQSGLRVVDPVFGDDGRLYASITLDMVAGMRALVSCADIITPNLTEAAFLLGEAPVDCLPRHLEAQWLTALRGMGPRNVLITSCRREGEPDCVAVLGMDEGGNRFRICSPMLPASFQGNGDLYASVLVGGMVNGLSLREAARNAAGFVLAAMRETIRAGSPPIEGVRLEKSLPLLIHPPQYDQITLQDE